ncbi:hypothetical protein ABFS82_03G013800 [Erythranthe guttata]
MRAKKVKATKLSTMPQHLIQPWNWKVRPNVINLGLTKSWVRWCNGSEDQFRLCPQIYQVDVDATHNPLDSTYNFGSSVVDVSTSQILPSTNAKIPSKFAPIISSHEAINTPCVSRLCMSSVSSPALFTYRSNPQNNDGPYTEYTFTLIKYECNTIDPFDAKKKRMQFTSIAKLQGVVVALSLQGALAVIQETDSCLTIKAISSSRAVPSVSSRFFKEYFVQLNGEIFLVFLINQKTTSVVDKVEVSRLCFPDLKWIKVEKIQGKTLFVDQCRNRVSSIETGYRGNCIYFTQGSENKWWIYDLGSACISPA